MYVRYQSPLQNSRGLYPGVFALANGLAQSGALTKEELATWRESNDWFTTNVIDPVTVDPDLFRRFPTAASWFNAEATDLIGRLPTYLAILHRHGVKCQRVESSSPGVIIYSDDRQVLAVPE